MSKILVTGGAGFIGSHTVDELIRRGHEVVVIDSLDPGAHAAKPTYLNDAAQYAWGDVGSPDIWTGALPGVTAVYHLAAKVGLGVSAAEVTDYVRANDLGTAVMLEALHRSGFRDRLILASSMVVYGEGRYRCSEHGVVRPGPRPRDRMRQGDFEPPCPECGRALSPMAVPEDWPLDPRSTYAATKVHQEHLCAAWARDAGAAFLALRYHNVYGPRMPRDTPYAGVASVFRSALEAGRAPRVFEDGRQLRDFVHVSDVARANAMALDTEPPAHGAVNVASGEPRTVGEMAGALAQGFGSDAPLPVVTGEFRPGDVRHVVASPEGAAELMGFRARIPFDEGMRELAHAELRRSVSGSNLDPDAVIAGGAPGNDAPSH